METSDSSTSTAILCPGQGAQVVGMGKAWAEASAAARETFDEADATLQDLLGASLSDLCFGGPAERLNQTDVSQPAIYACSVACYRGLQEQGGAIAIAATAGLSLGEYTALHLAGAFSFADGLKLVAQRGRFMQEAAEASEGGMVALIGADEEQAQALCDEANAPGGAPGSAGVLVCANFNAPGQIVLSGAAAACARAVQIAGEKGLRAKALTVAGAFHSPLMAPAADRMRAELAHIELRPLESPVFSNVTAGLHEADNPELLKDLLVQQITSPVRWAESCAHLVANAPEGSSVEYHELAPGTVLKGLMRRIDRKTKVISHDEPDPTLQQTG